MGIYWPYGYWKGARKVTGITVSVGERSLGQAVSSPPQNRAVAVMDRVCFSSLEFEVRPVEQIGSHEVSVVITARRYC